MSNPNIPFGFTPLQSEGTENRVREYPFDTTKTYWPGDVVTMNSAGLATLATAGQQVLGVVAAQPYSTSMTIKIYDDPNEDFFVQVTGNFAQTDVGENANIFVAAGSTLKRQSQEALDTSTEGTSSLLQFKIFGLYNRGFNALGSYAIVRVKPCNHFFRAGASGV
jgi:hypothetical protein